MIVIPQTFPLYSVTRYSKSTFKLIYTHIFFSFRNWSKSKRWLLAFFEKNIPDIKTYKSEKDNSMVSIPQLFFSDKIYDLKIVRSCNCYKYILLKTMRLIRYNFCAKHWYQTYLRALFYYYIITTVRQVLILFSIRNA